MEVKLGRVPGVVTEWTLREGATVKDLLDIADEKLDPTDALRVNGIDASTSTVLVDGDKLLITMKVKGNK